MMALLAVVILGMLVGANQMMQVRKMKNDVAVLDSVESFGLDEISAWHSYFRKLANSTLAEGTVAAVLENRSDTNISAITNQTVPTNYVDGAPLNLKATLPYDSEKSFVRRLSSSDFKTEYVTVSSKVNYCGESKFGKKSAFKMCLTEEAIPPMSSVFVTINHQSGDIVLPLGRPYVVRTGTDPRGSSKNCSHRNPMAAGNPAPFFFDPLQGPYSLPGEAILASVSTGCIPTGKTSPIVYTVTCYPPSVPFGQTGAGGMTASARISYEPIPQPQNFLIQQVGYPYYFNLTWYPLPGNGLVSGFQIERKRNSGSFSVLVETPGAYEDHAINATDTFTYRVRGFYDCQFGGRTYGPWSVERSHKLL